MRRGFKASAERHAEALRAATGSSDRETMDLGALARHLGVAVLPADELLDGGLDELQKLHRAQPGAFSAVTLSPPGQRYVVLYNPITLDGRALPPPEAAVDGRTRSNISHEFAHLVLDHDVRSVQKLGTHHFFTCNTEQEEEANWLAAAILLPRPLLLDAARRDLTEHQIADAHHVSPEMARFRLNATGVKMQVSRGRTPRA